MTTLIRRNTGDVSRRQRAEAALDPFRLVDAFFGGSPYGALEGWTGARGFAPDFEVRETENAYVFRADVPGVVQKDLEIQLTGNVLAIAGERKAESVHEGERYFAVERGYGRFSRSFALPEGTDGEHVTADLKDGVLTVSVPKKPEVQPRRISVGTPTTQAQPEAKA
jgi:HSP20 family protein